MALDHQLDRSYICLSEYIKVTAANSIDRMFRGCSERIRLRILSLLLGGELCVCDLAWVSERAENLVSHHLRALRAAGLVSGRRDGKMVMYSLTEAGRSLLQPVLDGAPVRA